MKERGILFTPENYAKCVAGTKTQTRRIVKPQPPCECEYLINGASSHALCRSLKHPELWVPPKATSKDHRLACPFGQPGDRIYAKEVHWKYGAFAMTGKGKRFVAANRDARFDVTEPADKRWAVDSWRKRSPLFMEKKDARLWLELTAVRVERIQQISYDDERAEGVTLGRECNDRHSGFIALWDSVNGAGAWERNDYVWVLDFRKVTA